MKKIILLVLSFVVINCCSLNKNFNQADYNQIINLISINNIECNLWNETFYKTIYKPEYLIKNYERLEKSNKNSYYYKLYSNSLILRQKDLKNMNKTSWELENWNLKNNTEESSKCFIKVSEPVYNKNHTKALVLISKKTTNNNLFIVYVLIKKANWKIVGGIPCGTGN